ncbi:hypothetical protein BA059_16830 [Mycolicibacterium sp. (ex Dasyatis americana)]|nr:hypothetical protein BA059_16830 [Mycolicibacterium sp. (ex Dasyatis americana)]
MPNQSFIDLLTQTFKAGSLPHPGDENRPPYAIPMPGFRGTGMSDEQAQEMIGMAAKNWAEALDHVVDVAGKTVIDKAELAQLRAEAADAPDGTRIIQVTTTPTSEPVLELPVKKTSDRVIVPASVLKKVGEHL